jgi:general secretion pathway protein L
MQTTLLRLGPGDEAEWAVLDSDPTNPVFVQRGRVEEASADANGRRLVVLVPTDALLLRQVVIAARNQRQLAKAVPYALEDDLAEGIDGLHFALGKRGDDGTPVAIVNESRLEAWLEQLGAVDLKPYALIPDVLSLPWTRGEWSVLIEGEHALVRTGEFAGYACEAWDLRELLAVSLEDTPEEQTPSRLAVFGLGEHLPDLGGLDIELAIEPVEDAGSALAVLARGHRPVSSLNLLQGRFSYRDERSQALRPWYAVAALALAWITILFASRGYEYISLKNQSAALTQQIEAVYRQTFPEAQRVVDARVQMEQQLRALRGGAGDDDSDFLALLAETAGLITAQQAVDVTAVSYRGGRLDLTVTAPNPQVLDSLRAQISERPGITAELQSVSASGDIASGQLRITTERT